MTGDIILAAKFIGAGLSMIGALGAGTDWFERSGRIRRHGSQSRYIRNLLTNMILGIAFSEAIAIYCLVIAFLMLFVL